jgi:enoyl-CoA hydratase/carnithine racemase
MTETILCTRDVDITRITLNRPDEGNRVTNDMAGALGEMIDAAGADGAKMVVLRGNGADFCLGRQIDRAAEGGANTALDIRAGNTGPALDLFAKFHRCAVPIIAVVQGQAVGLGCALAGLCDITLAAAGSTYQAPEMHRDLPPTLVMWALADRMPRKAIMYLIYSREEFDAEYALSMGLVSKIVPDAELDDTADALIALLSENSTPALSVVKEYMRSAPQMDRMGASDYASNLLANLLASR